LPRLEENLPPREYPSDAESVYLDEMDRQKEFSDAEFDRLVAGFSAPNPELKEFDRWAEELRAAYVKPIPSQVEARHLAAMKGALQTNKRLPRQVGAYIPTLPKAPASAQPKVIKQYRWRPQVLPGGLDARRMWETLAQSLPAKAGIAAALVLFLAGGLAMTGALGRPVRSAVQSAAGKVGIYLPGAMASERLKSPEPDPTTAPPPPRQAQAAAPKVENHPPVAAPVPAEVPVPAAAPPAAPIAAGQPKGAGESGALWQAMLKAWEEEQKRQSSSGSQQPATRPMPQPSPSPTAGDHSGDAQDFQNWQDWQNWYNGGQGFGSGPANSTGTGSGSGSTGAGSHYPR
jgi:hypothetical protein